MTSECLSTSQSASFCALPTGASVLDALHSALELFGSTHVLISGMPLPGRPLDPLLLKLNWGEIRGERRASIKGSDAVLQRAFRGHRANVWREKTDPPIVGESVLLDAMDDAGAREIAFVPICSFLPYQAVVVAGGTELALDKNSMIPLEHMCIAAFHRLFTLGYIRPERPGELSGRERRVVELSATGKTAGQIADILEISQRTVHAHLQNASEKLRAQNKTHTVVEALRYGQISI